MSPTNITRIKLDKLKLDHCNPRLPSKLRIESTLSQNIVNWMLQDASILELMLAIGQADFFVGEPLLVIKDKVTSTYTVIEGNRRLTSLILLKNPEIAEIHKNKIRKVLDETSKRPEDIPCIIFEQRKDVTQYLGYRHVTGVKPWGVLSKARYLNTLLKESQESTFIGKCRDIAKKIGSKSPHVRKLLVSFQIYEAVEDEAFFQIPDLDETSLYFNYFSDSLSKENIKKFIGVNLASETPTEKLDINNLKTLTQWFFKKNEHGKSRVLGNAEQLGMLNDVLENKDALDYFEKGNGSIKQAHNLVAVSADSYRNEIELALSALKRAQTIAHNVDKHHSSDIDKLKEVFTIARSMRVVIESKYNSDEWDD